MMLKELNTEECVFLFIINQVLTLHLHLHTSITIYPQVIYVFTYLITSNLLFICSGECDTYKSTVFLHPEVSVTV